MEQSIASRSDTARRQEMNDVKELMKTPTGRRFIWRVLEQGRIFQSTYTGTAETYYLEGKRDASLEIFQDVVAAADREDFFKMQDENALNVEALEAIHKEEERMDENGYL